MLSVKLWLMVSFFKGVQGQEIYKLPGDSSEWGIALVYLAKKQWIKFLFDVKVIIYDEPFRKEGDNYIFLLFLYGESAWSLLDLTVFVFWLK